MNSPIRRYRSKNTIPVQDGYIILSIPQQQTPPRGKNQDLTVHMSSIVRITADTRTLSLSQLSSLNRAIRFDLGNVLDDDESRAAFEDYLQKVSNQENYMFLRACDDFHNLRSSVNRYRAAKSIMETYILEGSMLEINVGQAQRQRIIARWMKAEKHNGPNSPIAPDSPTSPSSPSSFALPVSPEHCPKNLFEEMCSLVMFQLKMDVFPRFIASKEFAVLLRSLTQRRGLMDALELLGAETNDRQTNEHGALMDNVDSETSSSRLVHSSSFDTLSSESSESHSSYSISTNASTSTSTAPFDNSSGGSSSKERSANPSETNQTFMKKYVTVHHTNGPSRVDAFAYERVEKLIHPGIQEPRLWKQVFASPDNSIAWISKPFFREGNSNRIFAFRSNQEYDCTYEQLSKYSTSTRFRVMVETGLSDLQVVRFVSAVDTVRSKLEQLMKDKEKTQESDFDAAIEYSHVISCEYFKVPLSWKKRAAFMSTSMRHLVDQKKILVVSHTCSEPDLKQPAGTVQVSSFNGDIYEPCGPQGMFVRKHSMTVANMSIMIPSSIAGVFAGKKLQELRNRTLKYLKTDSPPSILEKGGEWGEAMQRTMAENITIDAMVQEYKAKFFDSE